MIVILKHLVFEALKDELVKMHVVVPEKNEYGSKRYKARGRHSYDGYSNSSCDVDMAALTMREAQNFLKVLDATPVLGTKVAAADVRKYLKIADEGLDGVKARTCRQAAWMLEMFFAQLPHHTIFSQDDYGGESHSGYFVTDVDYEPEKVGGRHDSRQEEYTEVNLCHVENDFRRGTKVTLHKGDCLNMTCLEILASRGYVPETPELMAKLRKETERFYSVQEMIGTQFVAKGLGLPDLDNALEKTEGWSRYRSNKIKLDRFGETRVVVDVLQESDEQKDRWDHSGKSVDPYRWHKWNMRFHAPSEDELVRHLEADEDTAEPVDVDIPVHPLVPCFDLRRHCRMRVHVNNLQKYVYDKTVAENLILPERDWKMIDLLVDHSENTFRDIVRGKGQSMNILCAGVPGTGKTASAEVFAEFKSRPLYTVQCSQLGLDAEQVEKNLSVIMDRANRWNAVLLLDEADVYIHKRGADLNQNAIVGAFLRVLEYASCILFMTTNLGDSVDDAITSRCIAKLSYEPPSPEDQAKIWRILADLNGLEVKDREIQKVVDKHPKLTGRDVKNILKLASFVCQADGKPLDAVAVEYALQFKPTE